MKKILAIALAAFLALPGLALAQGKFAYSELKPAQPTETAAGKIEVLEFFWYGCPHCYSLEPSIEVWSKKLPADVQFRRVPAVFNERWGHDAAIFYTFEALGVLSKLHRPFFDAIHRDRLRSDNQQALSEWLQKNGVDSNRFFDTMKSFGVQTRLRRATQLSVAYRIDGTPAMAVQGRYTVSAEQGRSHQGMLDTVDYLLDIARKQK
jgi:thiol:disulfide interchange protein DsbA